MIYHYSSQRLLGEAVFDFSSKSVETFHSDVLKVNDTSRIVCLQCESAFVELSRELLASLCAFRFGVFHYRFAINVDRDRVALHDDVLGKPHVVLRWSWVHVFDRVETARLTGVFLVGIVDLNFKTVLWPALFLVLRVEVNSAVRVLFRHHIDFEFEVDERLVIANVKQVSTVSVRFECSIFYRPTVFIFGSFLPTFKRLPVVEAFESVLSE